MGPMGPKGPHGAGPGVRARGRSAHQFWAWARARGPPGQPEGLLNLAEGLLHTFEYYNVYVYLFKASDIDN